uniref:Integrase n=1 Tax=Heterorhabditis bacteriophora TaxID=37862 RepID=A0A1I7X8A7_HETBA
MTSSIRKIKSSYGNKLTIPRIENYNEVELAK